MKTILALITTMALCHITQAQNVQSNKMGWFLNPEAGGIFHTDHFGKTLGASLGVKLFKDHLKVGFHLYGRPGPINPKEYTITPTNGQMYKGQSTLQLRADHGAFGIYLTPMLYLQQFRIEFPVTVGQLGGGFYLLGEDRKTPDGDRVSVWEDRLMDGNDAGFSPLYEFGVRTFLPLKHPNVSFGIGVHYTVAPDWETYTDPNGDLYNNRIRLACILAFESSRKTR